METYNLDRVDRQLLASLSEDARLSMSKVAENAGVSRATVYNRLERLLERGVIRQFSAIIDPAALGRGISALLMVNVDQANWRSARDAIQELPGVRYAALATGDRDVIMLVRANGIDELRDVVLRDINGLPSVRSTRTLLVLDEFVDRVNPSVEEILRDG